MCTENQTATMSRSRRRIYRLLMFFSEMANWEVNKNVFEKTIADLKKDRVRDKYRNKTDIKQMSIYYIF